MKKNSWLVVQEDIVPADPPDKCVYCGQPIGVEHRADCVCRERTVVVELRAQFIQKIPECWDKEMFYFAQNESRWCLNNALYELDDLAEYAGCLCPFGEISYIREATEEDEETFGVSLKSKRA